MADALFTYLPMMTRKMQRRASWLELALELSDRHVERRTCEDCQGSGLDGYLRSCKRCRNTGFHYIPPTEWVEAGRLHREQRKARAEHASDVARRLGCTANHVMRMERGELPAPCFVDFIGLAPEPPAFTVKGAAHGSGEL